MRGVLQSPYQTQSVDADLFVFDQIMERIYPSSLQSCTLITSRSCYLRRYGLHQLSRSSVRLISAEAKQSLGSESISPVLPAQHKSRRESSLLAPVPTASLLRSLALGYCLTSPRVLSLSLKIMNGIVHSKSAILNPDKNFALGAFLRVLVYNQFCAGSTPSEVRRTVAHIKKMGYNGVILGYGREIVLDEDHRGSENVSARDEASSGDPHITAWLEGNLKTVDLIGEGDYINIK